MKAYILSIVSASLVVSMLNLLSPRGTADGIAKHIRLLSSLFLICVLVSPVKELIVSMQELANGEHNLSILDSVSREEQESLLESTLNAASQAYFLESLTQLLEKEFSIQTGEIRCAAQWTTVESTLTPSKITVVLSGTAKWKNPVRIEEYVEELLSCECVTAIE